MRNRIHILGLAALMASSLAIGAAQAESRPGPGAPGNQPTRDMSRAAEMHTKMAEFHTAMAGWHRANPGATPEQARAEMERLRETMGVRGPRERGERHGERYGNPGVPPAAPAR